MASMRSAASTKDRIADEERPCSSGAVRSKIPPDGGCAWLREARPRQNIRATARRIMGISFVLEEGTPPRGAQVSRIASNGGLFLRGGRPRTQAAPEADAQKEEGAGDESRPKAVRRRALRLDPRPEGRGIQRRGQR